MLATQSAPAQLFHDFDMECRVPDNHMLCEIERSMDLNVMDINGMRAPPLIPD